MRRSMMALALAAACLAGAARPAHADGASASCTVTEILGTNDGKGMDPQLGATLKALLGKPPFSGTYNSFRLLGQSEVKAELRKPTTVRLQYGPLGVEFKDKVAVSGGKARLRVGLDLDDGSGSHKLGVVITAGSGDMQIPYAGIKFRDGTYILALTCTAQ
jgi:hypothetical protein